MNWLKRILQAVISIIWVVADLVTLTNPAYRIDGSPWITFGIVTYFGVFFSIVVEKM
jgi:hypothetical protein